MVERPEDLRRPLGNAVLEFLAEEGLARFQAAADDAAAEAGRALLVRPAGLDHARGLPDLRLYTWRGPGFSSALAETLNHAARQYFTIAYDPLCFGQGNLAPTR